MIQLTTNPFITWASRRVTKQNKNVIGCFLGATGSGKTYACLDFGYKLAETLGTPFSIDGNVAFTFSELLKKMEAVEDNLPGHVFIFEEVGAAGSGASSNEWQSKANVFFSSFLQTARHRNQILLFTTPNFSLLSKQARQLVHFIAEMGNINQHDKKSSAKIKITQTNPVSGKTYMKYIRVVHNNQRVAVKICLFDLPDKELLKIYEERKLEFTKKLNRKIIDHSEIDKPKASLDDVKRLIDKGYKKTTIAKMLGVTTPTIYNKLKQLV